MAHDIPTQNMDRDMAMGVLDVHNSRQLFLIWHVPQPCEGTGEVHTEAAKVHPLHPEFAREIARRWNAHEDLLEACKAALEHVKKGCWAGLSHRCCGPPEIGDKLRATIAKAEGE